jgi:uncharacterized damage-inducible protein DinB
MSFPQVIENAAGTYRFNSDFLTKMVADLSQEEWLKHPGDNTNHIAWIFGHLAYCRGRTLHFIGTEWSLPMLENFGRGKKRMEDSAYAAPELLLSAWSESGHALAAALENASEDLLAQAATQGPPSLDGKISGIVNFMAIHETLHVGQASYVRSWLGHKGLMG